MPVTSTLYGDGQKDADVFIDVTPTLLGPMRREAKARLALVLLIFSQIAGLLL